jgi:hypothetical protein
MLVWLSAMGAAFIFSTPITRATSDMPAAMCMAAALIAI